MGKALGWGIVFLVGFCCEILQENIDKALNHNYNIPIPPMVYKKRNQATDIDENLGATDMPKGAAL